MEPATSAHGVVLYVEDDRLNVALVAEIVALVPRARLHVEGTVAGAIAALRDHPPAIVLVDLDLPDGSGLEVVDAVAAVDAAASGDRRPTVLVVTGDVSTHTAATAAARGADGVVMKPYRVADLLASIEAALST